MPRHELLLPDLGLGDQPVTVSVWLVERGAQVKEGDPILEVLAGNAVVDLPAPADGVLAKRLVGEDERVEIGQRLAIIEAEEWA
jgi:pyruvate/2-oxoglutarate dehydrogenase complex dihydrolipoamide acyltransferase (E2) component